MDPQPHSHFNALRKRIRETMPLHAREEYARYDRLLYGAIGDPEADVMFICENPSRRGVEMAYRKYRHLGIEAQWRGKQPERLRRALRETGFLRDGQWRCYVTNVIKEIWTAGEGPSEPKHEVARRWAEVLAWEMGGVRPGAVICVGGESHKLVQRLAKEGAVDLGGASLCRMLHYSARPGKGETAETVVARMADDIRRCIRPLRSADTFG